MNVVVFGATGATGRELVKQALAAGHRVTAYVRDAAQLPQRPGLRILAGSTCDAKALGRALAGQDAVLSALGGRPWRRREYVCSSALRLILPAMERHGVRRIVAISTVGAGTSRAHVGWPARMLKLGLLLRSEVQDKEAMEAQLEASSTDWTVVRVGRLTDEPARGTWRAADDGSIRGSGSIARADVAAFMLGELDSTAWTKRLPVLMY
ncbi:MAG: NAD(P)H-binding protein [Rhodocyclaceae bacterium]|nr:NAD(P)H-binding protein [Rhodocyclaceae bacterium]MBX3669822.1 NAD(P)H-binding protein [Rhodocyclaceae bacterium]